MPKRTPEEGDLATLSRQSSDAALKSRSGRVVKPKVFNDGTVALSDEAGDFDADEAHDTCWAGFGEDAITEEDSLSDGSEGSYGSVRPRPGRLGRGHHHFAGAVAAAAAVSRSTARRNGYGGGGVFKQAAVEVLRAERRLMSTGDIARLALSRGLVQCSGRTPEATMASALYTDVKRKEEASVFVRPREGMFGLREWGWVAPAAAAVDTATYHRQITTTVLVEVAAPAEVELARIASDTAAPADSTGGRLIELLCAAEEEEERERSGEEDETGEEEVDTAAAAAADVQMLPSPPLSKYVHVKEELQLSEQPSSESEGVQSGSGSLVSDASKKDLELLRQFLTRHAATSAEWGALQRLEAAMMDA